MAQPEFVQFSEADRVRKADILPPPERWTATRPGDVIGGVPSSGDGFGAPGPDQGYALFLAKRFYDKLELVDGEHRADVVAGCMAVATKRASIFGRGPVIYDWELAFTLFGFLGGAPTVVMQARRDLFAEAGHHYWKRRAIADTVPEETLRMTPAAARAAMDSGKELLTLG